jgi:hypothetical protein
MRTLHTIPVLTALAVSAAASPAAAAPPWSPPQPVATTEVREPALAFNVSGMGVASLRSGAAATRILGLQAQEPAHVVASRDVGSVEDGPLPYGRTRTVSLRRRAVGRATTLGFSFGRSDGAVGSVRALRTVALRPGEAELAVAPNGNAVIAWVEERGGSTRVWLSVRRAGASRFTSPRVIRGSGSARSVAVSVNDRGRYVVGYVFGAGSTRTVEARIGTTAGTVGALQTVGRQLGIARLAAVVATTGRTTLAWTTRDGGEEQDEPTQLRTNVAPAGRTTFAGQVVLDRAADAAVFTEPSPPTLAAAPDGRTLVGYTLSGRFEADGSEDAVTPGRISVQDADARFTTPRELGADAVVGQVAARADGTFAVPFVRGAPLDRAASPLLVALVAPGSADPGPAETVTEDAGRESAAAFEPGPSGAPLVLYTRAREAGAAIARRGS